MKLLRFVVVLAAVAAGCHRQPAVTAGALPDDLLGPYLRIQENLAKDSLDGLAANATTMSVAAGQLKNGGADIAARAQKLETASSLADARQGFGSVSEALVAYATATNRPLPDGVRRAWCPMAGKPWLQRGSEIANPYYGKEMPNCGEFK